MEDQEKDDVQRWTTKRKAALVSSIVKGETSIQEAARQHGLTVAEIEDWKERFFMGAENALRAKQPLLSGPGEEGKDTACSQ